MPYAHHPSETLTKDDISILEKRALKTLESLVTRDGIYASVDNGWKGPYHSWFGRDGAITADLIVASLPYGGDRQLARTALEGLVAFSKWQGVKNDSSTGEEFGKLPHEVRDTFNSVDEVQHASGTNQLPWYVDPADGLLKNWDSADSTPLWVIAVVRAHRALDLEVPSEVVSRIRRAVEWILRTIETHHGLLGFIGADLQPARQYSGLHNQGWKDTFQIYQDEQGNLAAHPIKDVLINAEAWLALRIAAPLFDSDMALRMNFMADELRKRFNRVEDGFLLPDESYYAQAIDGQGRQLRQRAADVGMCLWVSEQGECAIDARYVDTVARTVTGFDLFNPRVGIRNYAVGTEFPHGTLYHGSAFTYWPFVSALVARGLLRFGYKSEALDVTKASLLAVKRLGSNIEMFMETPNGQLVAWHHPKVGQQSSLEQAWTAASVYFGTHFLRKADG
ncbi:hypothetical protein PV379_00200 [Streptomyces caniscabiei]|uniref:amylo-alpha-1,6-glucosidase n=1 Tax=Streptomyces caniscabiei TaxID=2746961 RepID=UPI0029AC7E59|nr:hypothetical protein [Streptomyces caniscabiei]MDX2775779.1 hypothetical protein [Streptomyces caniscabiei]